MCVIAVAASTARPSSIARRSASAKDACASGHRPLSTSTAASRISCSVSERRWSTRRAASTASRDSFSATASSPRLRAIAERLPVARITPAA